MNPTNDVPDFREVTNVAHKHGLPVFADNTVLTPVPFRPIEHGADVAIYSTTKLIGGHGVHIGGAIVDSGRFLWADDPKKWPEFIRLSIGIEDVNDIIADLDQVLKASQVR